MLVSLVNSGFDVPSTGTRYMTEDCFLLNGRPVARVAIYKETPDGDAYERSDCVDIPRKRGQGHMRAETIIRRVRAELDQRMSDTDWRCP